MSVGGIDEFLRELGLIIAEYQHSGRNFDAGRDRSIGFGNVRYRKWENSGRINIGIIYETPGGSTNQINVEYQPATGLYGLPHADSEGEFASIEEPAVLAMIRTHIEQIPEKRNERLCAYVDALLEEGRPRSYIFGWLNELLYQDLKGGRVTHGELAEACHYVVNRLAGANSGGRPA